MEAAYYEEVRGRLTALLTTVEPRLPERGRAFVVELIDVGEYGLALETMADLLSEDAVAVTDAERDEMLALVSKMEMGDRVARALALCPRGE